MKRRAFLASLAAAFAAAFALDPERLLWRPGAKLISIPKPAHLPLWLSIQLEDPLDRAYIHMCVNSLIDEWKERERRDGVTYAPVRPHEPKLAHRVEMITIGRRGRRFPIRLIQAWNPLDGRMLARLDMMSG